MTEQELVATVKKATEEYAKRSPDEGFQDLIDAGIIDKNGRVFSESLAMVEDLLREKGFGKVCAFHRGDVPEGAVRLEEKVADTRRAEGPYDKILKIIKKARSHEGLWKALETAGYRTTPDTPG